MQSILQFRYNSDGTVARQDTNALFQGQVGTAEYRITVSEGSDVLSTDTVLISFERPDGKKISQKMRLSQEGWDYPSNGWETDSPVYAGGGDLKVGFVILRYSQFDATRVSKTTTTEPVTVQVEETAGYTPLEIADDVSSEILETLSQVEAEIQKRTNIENGAGEKSLQQVGSTAEGEASHAEGLNTKATKTGAHSEGTATTASGMNSHAEGYTSTASGAQSHAEGQNTKATTFAAHAEGFFSMATGEYSHAEGSSSSASGANSHAEGWTTTASEESAHAEGTETKAIGKASHAEGKNTEASGDNSHAGGHGTKATGKNQTAIGQYNVRNDEALFIVGNGENSQPATALEVLKDGTVTIPGKLDATAERAKEADHAVTADSATEANHATEADRATRADSAAAADKAMADTLGNRIDTHYASKQDLENIIGGAPESFDTLKEVADWIKNDETGTAALIGRVGALESGKASKEELAAVEEAKADKTTLAVYASQLAAVEEAKADRTELDAYATNEKVDSLHQQVLDMDPIVQKVQGDAVTLTGTPSGKYLEDYKVLVTAEQDGEPSPANPVAIRSPREIRAKSINANFCLVEKPTSTINGITYTVNDDKSVRIAGTATANAVFFLNDYGTKKPRLEKGTYYFYETKGGQNLYALEIQAMNTDGTLSYFTANPGSESFTVTKEVQNWRASIFVRGGVTVEDTIYPMFSPAEKSSVYQEYTTDETLFSPKDLQGNAIEMFGGVPGAENTLEWIDGRPYWVQRTGKVVYDGTEQWNRGNSTGEAAGVYQRFYGFRTEQSAKPASGNGSKALILCPVYKGLSANDTYAKAQGIAIDTSRRTIVYDDTYSPTGDLDGFKAWLAKNPMALYYQLATPIYTELDPLTVPSLQTYDPQTTIEMSSDVAGLFPVIDFAEYSIDAAKKIPTLLRDEAGNLLATPTLARLVEAASGQSVQEELDGIRADYATTELVESLHREVIDLDVPVYDEKRGDFLTVDGTTEGQTVEPQDYGIDLPLLQDGEPTPSNPIPILSPTSATVTSYGKNLFDKHGDFRFQSYDYARDYTSLVDGKIQVTNNFSFYRSDGQVLPTRPSTTYTVSGTLVSNTASADNTLAVVEILQVDKAAAYGGKDYNVYYVRALGAFTFHFTTTADENKKYWISLNGIAPSASETSTIVFDNLQVEIGSGAATAYEDYQSADQPILPKDLQGNPIALSGGLPGAENGIEWRDGKPYWVQRTEKAVFVGSADENWELRNKNDGGISTYSLINPAKMKMYKKKIGAINYICNDCVAVGQIAGVTDAFANGESTICFLSADNDGTKAIYVNTALNTLALFRTWLANHPLETCYELATPIYTELDPSSLPALQTYRGLTHFATSSDIINLYPTLDLSALSVRNATFTPVVFRDKTGQTIAPMTVAEAVQVGDGKSLAETLAWRRMEAVEAVDVSGKTQYQAIVEGGTVVPMYPVSDTTISGNTYLVVEPEGGGDKFVTQLVLSADCSMSVTAASMMQIYIQTSGSTIAGGADNQPVTLYKKG